MDTVPKQFTEAIKNSLAEENTKATIRSQINDALIQDLGNLPGKRYYIDNIFPDNNRGNWTNRVLLIANIVALILVIIVSLAIFTPVIPVPFTTPAIDTCANCYPLRPEP